MRERGEEESEGEGRRGDGYFAFDQGYGCEVGFVADDESGAECRDFVVSGDDNERSVPVESDIEEGRVKPVEEVARRLRAKYAS